jgi:hypothetical protein
VIANSACPTRRSASRTTASRSASTVSRATARPSSRVPGRRVLCAEPPEPPRCLPHRLVTHHHLLIDKRPSLRPKPLPTSRAVIADDLDVFRVPPPISRIRCATHIMLSKIINGVRQLPQPPVTVLPLTDGPGKGCGTTGRLCWRDDSASTSEGQHPRNVPAQTWTHQRAR